jgi:hypothetical protein
MKIGTTPDGQISSNQRAMRSVVLMNFAHCSYALERQTTIALEFGTAITKQLSGAIHCSFLKRRRH